MATGDSEPTDVPAQVFEEFVGVLSAAQISEDVIARLRHTLLVEKKFTEAALRAAVFGDEA